MLSRSVDMRTDLNRFIDHRLILLIFHCYTRLTKPRRPRLRIQCKLIMRAFQSSRLNSGLINSELFDILFRNSVTVSYVVPKVYLEVV